MNTWLWIAYLIGVLIVGFIGAAIGNTKGRPGAGFALGFLLGPIGLIIIAVMDRTPALEAQRSREIRRLSGERADAPRALVTASRAAAASPADDSLPPVQWADIQAAARQDPSRHTPDAVLRSQERFRRGVNGPPIWFFADGAFNFVGRLAGTLIAANPEQAVEIGSDAAVTFERRNVGEIAAVTIDKWVLLNPRPLSEVTRFLAVIDAQAVPSSDALVAPATAADSTRPEEAAAIPTAPTVRDALAQLEDLRASRLISEEEHAAKRAEILSRL